MIKFINIVSKVLVFRILIIHISRGALPDRPGISFFNQVATEIRNGVHPYFYQQSVISITV